MKKQAIYSNGCGACSSFDGSDSSEKKINKSAETGIKIGIFVLLGTLIVYGLTKIKK